MTVVEFEGEHVSNMDAIEVWGVRFPISALRQVDVDYLVSLASMKQPHVEWVWQEMDRVWDELALDNQKALSGQAIGEFYSHPIWMVNGVFTSIDPISVQHRELIAKFIGQIGARNIADYGGGFGELALRLNAAIPEAQIDIVEPYPSKLGMSRVEGKSGIRFINNFDGQYDCVVAQDVLEHVEEPIFLAEQMVRATKMGGYLIFANCFFPVIKCHLPSTFYLRHTFAFVVKAMGLRFVGRAGGVEHALVFQRSGNVNAIQLRLYVSIAKLVGEVLNKVRPTLGVIKRRLS